MGKWQLVCCGMCLATTRIALSTNFLAFRFIEFQIFFMCLTRVFVAVFCFIIEHMCRQSLRKALMNALNLQHFPWLTKLRRRQMKFLKSAQLMLTHMETKIEYINRSNGLSIGHFALPRSMIINPFRNKCAFFVWLDLVAL